MNKGYILLDLCIALFLIIILLPNLLTLEWKITKNNQSQTFYWQNFFEDDFI